MDEIEFETEMTFKQVDYLITVKKIQVTTFEPSNQRLFIEVEEKLTGELWRGEFPARYIEDITTKTGVPKKFPEFIRMVLRSLKGQEGDSVYIDLLTYADLEQLKSKRSGSQANSAASQNPANSKKRYIILTELMNASGVDKVHYPLPLNYLEEPEPDALRRTIERMRGQILMQRSNAFSIQSEPVRNNRLEDFATIEKENDHLRREVAEMERQFSLSNQEFFNMS
jgi:coiled-coil domain-containing protein 61